MLSLYQMLSWRARNRSLIFLPVSTKRVLQGRKQGKTKDSTSFHKAASLWDSIFLSWSFLSLRLFWKFFLPGLPTHESTRTSSETSQGSWTLLFRAVDQALTPVPFSTASLLCIDSCHPKLITYCIQLCKWIQRWNPSHCRTAVYVDAQEKLL